MDTPRCLIPQHLSAPHVNQAHFILLVSTSHLAPLPYTPRTLSKCCSSLMTLHQHLQSLRTLHAAHRALTVHRNILAYSRRQISRLQQTGRNLPIQLQLVTTCFHVGADSRENVRLSKSQAMDRTFSRGSTYVPSPTWLMGPGLLAATSRKRCDTACRDKCLHQKGAQPATALTFLFCSCAGILLINVTEEPIRAAC